MARLDLVGRWDRGGEITCSHSSRRTLVNHRKPIGLRSAVLQQHLAIKGDYNGNGSVEASDYVYWRKHLNQNVTAGTAADGDGNGVIGPSDYGIWRQNFGRTRVSWRFVSGSRVRPRTM